MCKRKMSMTCVSVYAGEVETRQWLAQIGCWGLVFSCLQALLLERSQLLAMSWTAQVLSLARVADFALELHAASSRRPACAADHCWYHADCRAASWLHRSHVRVLLRCSVCFKVGGAAVLNLSLLTSDLWAAAAQIAFFGAYP